MNIVAPRVARAFAIWITGLPASGKSTLTAALKDLLAGRDIDVEVLESDALRRVFTPQPSYDEQERKRFYSQMVFVGEMLTRHGVPVIFDATANRRAYRDAARAEIPRFLEIYMDCPLELCVQRDPKGIYAAGRQGGASTVPGSQEPYEPPDHPDLVVRCDRESPRAAAQRVLQELIERGYV